ncbi:MAG: hypothetical protein AABZ29_03740 [Gemmatimonadota bacterium]
MTTVEKWFFTPLYYPRSPLQVIGWWERRRLMYNVSVGVAGLLTLGVGAALGMLLSPGTMPSEVVGVIVYGFLANVCYTLGPVADLMLRRTIGIRAPDIAPVMFRYGYVFSIGLTLLPIPLMMVGAIAKLVLGMGAAT